MFSVQLLLKRNPGIPHKLIGGQNKQTIFTYSQALSCSSLFHGKKTLCYLLVQCFHVPPFSHNCIELSCRADTSVFNRLLVFQLTHCFCVCFSLLVLFFCPFSFLLLLCILSWHCKQPAPCHM